MDNVAIWSGETNHCTVPGCETAGITVTNPVTVTVQDTASQPKSGLLVTAFIGSTPIPTGRFTNENGQAVLTLPVGSYRFRVNYNGTNFWSGTVNHCSVPGCNSAQIIVPGPIPVTVLDSDDMPQVGLPVYGFNERTFAGVSGTTDRNGRVLLTLHPGNSFIKMKR